MTVAITRDVSPRFAECELTHLERVPIDVGLAQVQHQNYIHALRALHCRVIELHAESDLPDSVFVEDTAVILPEAAIITRPGANSRKPETASVAEALRPFRELIFIEAPAELDGGDVLVLDKDIYVGLSTRSDRLAVRQMQSRLRKYSYRVQGVELRDCLHLKSAVTRLNAGTLLIHRDWVDARPFENYKLIDIAPTEPFAANILMIGETGIYPTSFPRTQEILSTHGIQLITVDVSELAKAEGAVTCCSLIVD